MIILERDMDLVRQLFGEVVNGKEYNLLVILEKFNDSEQYEKDKKIKYHLELMKQVGFLDYEYYSDLSGIGYFRELKLTWEGQDYYSNIKTDTIWNKIKEHLKSKSLTIGEVGFDIIINIAKLKLEELTGASKSLK